MAVDALGNPLRQLSKKRKKLKQHFIRSSPNAIPYHDIALVPTPSSTPKSDPVVYPSITEASVETPHRFKRHVGHKTELPLEIITTESPLEALQDSFTKAQCEIADMRAALHKESQRHMQEKLHLKQEMLFDIIRSKEQSVQAVNKLLREKHYLNQYAKTQKMEAEQQKRIAEEEVKKHDKVKLDLNYFKNEVEHLQAMNKVMEEDLDELRQIENEDEARRNRKLSGLPPAYGSLDDEDLYPLPVLHEDSGSFNVAVFKRAVREQFMQQLSSAQTLSRTGSFDENGKPRTPDCVFYVTSCALSDSCRSLRTALENAENILTTQMYAHAGKTKGGGVDRPVPLHIAKRCIARRDFVADRIAKTLLDLCWRVVSASELRPLQLHVDKQQKVRLSLVYKEVDECMLEALRQMFTLRHFGVKKDSLLWEYQHYYTQVNALRRALNNLRAGISYNFFGKTYSWLEEQVETERMNQANRLPEEQAAEEARPDVMGGSEVSSEEARSVYESCADGS